MVQKTDMTKSLKKTKTASVETEKSNLKMDFRVTVDNRHLHKRLGAENLFITELLKVFDRRPKKDVTSEDEYIDEIVCEEEPVTTTVKSSEVLVQKLQKKMEDLRGKRGYQHKKDKQKLSKKLKTKQLQSKKKKKVANLSKMNGTATVSTAVTKKPLKPVYNQEGKMVFNKFDFHVEGEVKPDKKGSGTDPKALLQKLEKEKNAIQALKDVGEMEKAANLVEKKMWENALDRVQGVKVKDNPKLLKKASKRKEQQKKKSRKRWEEIEESVLKKKEMKQKQRLENISKKKQQKINKKLKKSAKKGRALPGF